MVQVKYEMLRRVHNEGLPVAQAAALFGLSRPTFYHARQVFQAGGLPGLIRQRPGPKRASKLSEDVMHYLELLLADGAKPSAAALAEQVRQHFGLVVHPRSIERALQRRQKKGR
jgi:transposase